MSRYEGKNYQTIAKETNLSVKSIEFHISKALNLLRKELKDYLPCLLFLLDFFLTSPKYFHLSDRSENKFCPHENLFSRERKFIFTEEVECG
ncbi:MAG: hypothetical protein V8T12_11930 [Parabacteroides johnsonii]